jgi:hypothetical protein
MSECHWWYLLHGLWSGTRSSCFESKRWDPITSSPRGAYFWLPVLKNPDHHWQKKKKKQVATRRRSRTLMSKHVGVNVAVAARWRRRRSTSTSQPVGVDFAAQFRSSTSTSALQHIDVKVMNDMDSSGENRGIPRTEFPDLCMYSKNLPATCGGTNGITEAKRMLWREWLTLKY